MLLLGQGLDCAEVAQRQGLCVLTVRTTRRAWREEGLAGLADKPRCGTPPKLAEPEVQRLVQWANEEPLSMRAAITRRATGRNDWPGRDGQLADAAVAGFQWCGSSSAMRLAGCVGRRSSTSLRYA